MNSALPKRSPTPARSTKIKPISCAGITGVNHMLPCLRLTGTAPERLLKSTRSRVSRILRRKPEGLSLRLPITAPIDVHEPTRPNRPRHLKGSRSRRSIKVRLRLLLLRMLQQPSRRRRALKRKRRRKITSPGRFLCGRQCWDGELRYIRPWARPSHRLLRRKRPLFRLPHRREHQRRLRNALLRLDSRLPLLLPRRRRQSRRVVLFHPCRDPYPQPVLHGPARFFPVPGSQCQPAHRKARLRLRLLACRVQPLRRALVPVFRSPHHPGLPVFIRVRQPSLVPRGRQCSADQASPLRVNKANGHSPGSRRLARLFRRAPISPQDYSPGRPCRARRRRHRRVQAYRSVPNRRCLADLSIRVRRVREVHLPWRAAALPDGHPCPGNVQAGRGRCIPLPAGA